MVDTVNKVIGHCSRDCTKKTKKGICNDTFARIVGGECSSQKPVVKGEQGRLF